jgi:hypothetical protein
VVEEREYDSCVNCVRTSRVPHPFRRLLQFIVISVMGVTDAYLCGLSVTVPNGHGRHRHYIVTISLMEK